MTRGRLIGVIVACIAVVGICAGLYQATAQYEITADERDALNSLGRSVGGGGALGEALHFTSRGSFEDDVIATAELADNAVTSAKVLNATVGAADLGADSVTAIKIAADAVEAAEIAAGAVGTAEVDDGTLTAADLAPGCADTDEIATDAVTAAELATGSVGTDELDGTLATIDFAADAITEQLMLWDTVFPLQAPGTWGHGAGNGQAVGCLLGGLTLQPVGYAFSYVVAGATWVDETVPANENTADDVEVFAVAPAVNDAMYVGDDDPFMGISVRITTPYVALGGMTVALEYYNGGGWLAIPAATVEDATAGLLNLVGAPTTWVCSFIPPADWATTTMNGQLAYWIRWRCATFVSITTEPQVGQIWLHQPDAGVGVDMPFDCAITAVTWSADVISAANGNSDLALINLTTGLYQEVTITAATYCGTDTLAAPLAVTAGDDLAIVQLTEDGTTEFADVTLSLHCRVGG